MKGFASSPYSCLANTHMLCSSSIPLSIATNHNHLDISPAFPRCMANSNRKLAINHSRPNRASCSVVRCASWSLMTELEGDLKLEEEQEDGETAGIARYRHKCGEGKGAVELLECLEREAIMGADIGKEPMDYNRRAQIFDTSSRVFQALRVKEMDSHTSSTDDDVLSTP